MYMLHSEAHVSPHIPQLLASLLRLRHESAVLPQKLGVGSAHGQVVVEKDETIVTARAPRVNVFVTLE